MLNGEKTAMWARHLELGRAALALGVATLEGFAAVSAAFARDDFAGAEDAWVRFGGLSHEALERVVAYAQTQAAAEPPVTRPIIAERAEGGAAGTAAVVSVVSPGVGSPAAGARVRYQSMGVLGIGGMGKVVECLDTQLGRRVALKTIRPDYTGRRSEAALMLEREARLTGGLEHPNIIPVYDAGEHQQLGPQYVMRLVEQPTLDRVLRDLRAGDAKTQEEYRLGRLLRYLVQVCQAIEYAHSRGVIHCDLKPANILLGAFGEVIVVDWGLAYSAEEGVVYRGGTPGYMAPEQLDRSRKAFDPRTDVFALGCILYEVLTLRPPFTATLHEMLTLRSPFTTPPRPSVAAPERNVPVDLEDIAMAAIALDPAARTASAREMASALEAVIEGTKERERRRARADELAAEGDDLARSHFEYWASARPQQLANLEAMREAVAPYEPPAAKTQLWEAEDRLAIDDSLGGRILQASIAAYEQALAQIPEHTRARQGLASLYYGELQRAQEERRDRYTQLYLHELVRLYDENGMAESVSRLAITWSGERAPATLVRLEERERRLLPGSEQQIGEVPVPPGGLSIEPGVYTLSLRRPDGHKVHYPFHVATGRSIELRLEQGPSLSAGEVFIPAGPALIGGGYLGAAPVQGLRTVHVDGFVIAEHPVSVAEYLEFVEDVYRRMPERGEAYLPARPDGAPYWERHGAGDYVPRGTLDWGTAEALRRLPVFGVDAFCAEAFAAWKSERTGQRYRLPTELEWEKAARGTDGRAYPWGDVFDASFCKMRDSRPFAPRPEPSGTFAADISPYGVRDMAGGIAEWVLPVNESADPSGARLLVTRGGAWCDWQVDCMLASRRPVWASERAARLGFRLARDL